MEMTKKFIFTILNFSLSTAIFAAPNLTSYIVNKDSEPGNSEDISIDYTICSDVLEKNPICSPHEKRLIYRFNPVKFEFKNEKEVLYIWKASTYVYGGEFIENDFSKELQGSNKQSLIVSDCAITSRKLIVLDTYGTRKVIGCQIINSGRNINEGKFK